MKILVDIYRSAKKEGMYLFVKKSFDLETLPQALSEAFGKPEFSMTLMLTPERKLARADSQTVINALEEQGYYLQMPPLPEFPETPPPNEKLTYTAL